MEPSQMTIDHLPIDQLHQIFSHLSTRQIFACRAVCRLFRDALTCPFFIRRVADRGALNWFVVRPSHGRKSRRASPDSVLNVYDADRWVRFRLDFLPFASSIPVAAACGLLYLWCESADDSSGPLLVSCNPLTRKFRLLPPLGSAWFRHGTVLSSGNFVVVLDELTALYLADGTLWSNFSSGLSSKPRSPVLVGSTVYALCDVGLPWRQQWKLFFCKLDELGHWDRLEQHQWGEIFDILLRPRLIQGKGQSLLMVGGLKSSFTLNTACSTIVILRLDLDTLEWDEADRMPPDFFECFRTWGKFKVFGMGERVFFSGKDSGKLALWDSSDAGKGAWRWVSGVSEIKDALCQGFAFDARIDAVP